MLLFRNGGIETHQHLSAAERAALAQQWNDWCDGLARQGKLQHGQPLAPEGRLVSGRRGESVIDGPYAEAKEAVAGYIAIFATDLDEATSIARQCPSLPLGLTVEVRPLLDRSPVLEDLNARPAPPAGA